MKKQTLLTLILCLFSINLWAATDIETIIIVRHGEKPASDLGQLSCQGLNRSLKLPAYFKAHFHTPNAIYAPNPSVQNAGFSYVRPLATIEPTAISLTMPVNTQIGYNEPKLLVSELLKASHHSDTIIVAWEHKAIEKIAAQLLKHFHNPATVPAWPGSDYNRVYVFHINWNGSVPKLSFSINSEKMNHLSTQCPTH